MSSPRAQGGSSTTAPSSPPHKKAKTVVEEEVEDGEIEEELSPEERIESAWILDLSQPPRERLKVAPLKHVCEFEKKIDGLWLEFGVFSGQTINLMASFAPENVTVYGFDTFSGLPETWRNKFEKGKFDRKGVLPNVRPNVQLIKGLFQESLVPFLEKLDEKMSVNKEDSTQVIDQVSVCHLDADLYSATIFVLETLAPRIKPGTILVFDELINYPEYRQHEWKAWLEATQTYGWEFEWVAQSALLEKEPVLDVWDTQQVALRVL